MTRKSHILFVVSTPPPTGGAAVMNQTTIDVVKRQGVPIIHINPRFALKESDREKPYFRKLIELVKVELRIIFYIFIKYIHKGYFNLNGNLNAFVKDFLLLLVPLLLKKKIIIHLHCSNLGEFYEGSNAIIKKILRSIADGDTLFIVLSKSIKERLKHIIPIHKMIVINNGIDFPKYKIQRSTGRVDLVCLFLGILIKSKGFFKVIEAAKVLCDPSVTFHIVGPPGQDYDEREIHDYIRKNNLSDKAVIHGPLHGREKEEIYARSDIFIFPTSFAPEAFPLVLLEAMAYGLCIISSAKGAIPEIIKDKRNGYILKSNHPSEIADIIHMLKRNPKTLKQIRINNLIDFSAFYSIQKYEKAIQRVL